MSQLNKQTTHIYLAGRIEKRAVQTSKGHRWGLVNTILSKYSEDIDPNLILIEPKPFEAGGKQFIYTGPYTLDDDHGGSHSSFSGNILDDVLNVSGYGSRSHGGAPDITICPDSKERDIVAAYTYQRALNGILACDVFFAHIGDTEAYGTLVELGYARALGKHIVLGVPPMVNIDRYDPANSRGELWFAYQSADEVVRGFTAEECFIQWAETTDLAQQVGK